MTFESEFKIFERSAICDALKEQCGNVAATARLLGIPTRTLWWKIKRSKINPAKFRKPGAR